MGTRSITIFLDEEDTEIAVLYRQYDGYIEGHGKELRNFLKNKEIINGISIKKQQTKDNSFNGMANLAANTIAHFAGALGNFYLYPPNTRNIGEDYIYIISGKVGDKEATVTIKDYNIG